MPELRGPLHRSRLRGTRRPTWLIDSLDQIRLQRDMVELGIAHPPADGPRFLLPD